MRRRDLLRAGLGLTALTVAGCRTTAGDQVAALSPSGSATGMRARQSRRFDTTDRALMLQASVGALQDMGFAIDESDARAGVIVGSKLAGATLRAQITLRDAADGESMVLRALFQRVIPRPGAQVDIGETLRDPELYQGFFEKVAQSAFLTANEI